MFYNHENFKMEDFIKFFYACYSLMYNGVIEEKAEDVQAFDNMLKTWSKEDADFYNKFCEARFDICTSDREAAAYTMTFKNFVNERAYKI